MRFEVERALMAAWLKDDTNEFSQPGDLTEDMFLPENRDMFKAAKNYKSTTQTYDFILMTSIMGMEFAKELNGYASIQVNCIVYRDLLRQVKKINSIQKIYQAVESGDITPEFLKEQVLQLETEPEDDTLFDFRKDWNLYLEELHKKMKGDFVTYNTYIKELDEMLGYILPGYLIILGGRHGTGKTNFCIKIMKELIQKDTVCLYMSSEMSASSLINKMVSQQITGLRTRDLKDGKIDDPMYSKVTNVIEKTMFRKPILIKETGNFSIDKMRRYVDANKVKVLFIDFIQMFALDISRGQNAAGAMSEIARQLKAFAIEKDIVIYALSQVNMDGMMKESRGIEEKADVVIRLDSQKIEDDAYSKLIKIVVTKNRFGAEDRIYCNFSKINCDFKVDERDPMEIEQKIKDEKRKEDQWAKSRENQ